MLNNLFQICIILWMDDFEILFDEWTLQSIILVWMMFYRRKSVEVNLIFFFNYDSKNDKILNSLNLILIFDANDVK
jgi:hypothetical protein